jgi:hypothetical protein
MSTRIVHHKSPVGALVIVGAAAGVLFTTWLQKPSAPIMPAQSAIAAPAPVMTADQITAAVKAALPAPAAAPAPAAPTVKTVVKTVVKRVHVKTAAPSAPRLVFAVPHYHICSCSM